MIKLKIKRVFAVTGCTAFAVVLTVGGIMAGEYSKMKKTAFTLPETFTVTAHTGCEGTEDNTLESIAAGINAGADVVEVDLHFLPDYTAVLCHDEPKEKLVSEKMPSLESAFVMLARHSVKMNIDVKSTAGISGVKALAEKYGVVEKIFFTGVEEKDIEAVRTGAPDVPYYLNMTVDKKKNTDSAYLSSLVKKVKDCGAVGINMKYTGCSAELVEAFRSEGLLVSLWTANSTKEMYRCLVCEPDNITTRKPGKLIQLSN